jgi:hypothetical protein
MKITNMLAALGCIGAASAGAFKESDYSNTQDVTPDYKLWWKVDGDLFKVAMRAKTLGWVSFGITEQASGSMPGSDMVVGRVVDGVAIIEDMYATKFEAPMADASQDWYDGAGFVEDGYTTITATRKLVTNDNFDRPLVDLGFPVRISAAW